MKAAFVLKVRTLNESNWRGHWAPRAKRVRTQRRMAHGYTLIHARAIRRSRGAIIVTLTRVSSGTLDDDGLVSSQKAIRDGIADALGIDDGDPRIRFVYQQRPGARGHHLVEVAIETREAA